MDKIVHTKDEFPVSEVVEAGSIQFEPSNVQFTYRGWTYICLKSDDAGYRHVHFAKCGGKVVRMDYSSIKVMPKLVFEWMVKLEFPSRHDLPHCSHFELSGRTPLSDMEVERIWLWRQVNQLAA